MPFSNSANPPQVCLPTLQRLNILKALPICFPNSRLRGKSVWKRKAGSNYSLIRKLSTRKSSKTIATSAAEYRECLPRLVLRLKRKLITNNFQIFIWTYNFLSVSWCYQTERKFLYGIRNQILLPSKICPRLRAKQLSQRAHRGALFLLIGFQNETNDARGDPAVAAGLAYHHALACIPLRLDVRSEATE